MAGGLLLGLLSWWTYGLGPPMALCPPGPDGPTPLGICSFKNDAHPYVAVSALIFSVALASTFLGLALPFRRGGRAEKPAALQGLSLVAMAEGAFERHRRAARERVRHPLLPGDMVLVVVGLGLVLVAFLRALLPFPGDLSQTFLYLLVTIPAGAALIIAGTLWDPRARRGP